MMRKQNVLQLILGTIQSSPQDCTIRSLQEQTRISRNTLAKYLDILTERGEIEMKRAGATKHYSISERVTDSFLLRVAMDPVCLITGTFQIKAYNPPFFELFMNRSDRWRGREISFLLPEFGSSSLQRQLGNAMGGHGAEDQQEILCSGRRYTFRLKFFPLLYQDGSSGVGLLFRDETGTQRLNQALCESRAKYLAIVEDQLDLVCRRMPDLTISFVNRAYCEAARRTSEELIGERIFPFAFSKSTRGTEAVYAQISPDNPVIYVETKDMHTSGLIAWYQWTIRGFFADKGEFIGYQAIGRDITLLKNTQEQLAIYQKTLELFVEDADFAARDLREGEKKPKLQDQQMRMQAIFTSLAEPCLLIEIFEEKPGVIVDTNEKLCLLLQYSREELLQMDSQEFLPDEKKRRILLKLQEGMREDPLFSFFATLTRKDGSHILAEAVPVCFTYKEKTFLLVIVRYLSPGREILPSRKLNTIFRDTEDSDEPPHFRVKHKSRL